MGGKPKKPKKKGPSKEDLRLLELRRQSDLKRFRSSQLRRTILSPATEVANRSTVGSGA